MNILKPVSILVFSVSWLISGLQVSAQELVGEEHVGSENETKLITENNDTFLAIALREFGHLEIAVALAKYNRLPFDAVFSAEQEVYYPDKFAARPSSLEVVFSRGDVSYFPGGNENSRAQVTTGDSFYQTDMIETGPDGFASLKMPLGESINIQPEHRFKFEYLRCLPNDGYCPVLIDEENSNIYTNIKERTARPDPVGTHIPHYQTAADRGGLPVEYSLTPELELYFWRALDKPVIFTRSDCSDFIFFSYRCTK